MGVAEVKITVRTKRIGKNSGRSNSNENPTGVRRKSEGKELAPRSLRRLGKTFMTDCTEGELKKVFG
jgi:hypothetical protein